MKQKAFTLIELLVVMGIIGIVSAIGVVSFGAVREKARRGACIATLRSNFNSDENLVAYWNFDEQSPGTVAPTTAGAIKDFWGHNGTVIGDANTPEYQAGIIDSALYFDGINDYIIANNLNIPSNGTATIEGWFSFNGQFALTRGSSIRLFTNLYQHSANNHFYIYSTNDYFAVATFLQLNKRHHIVFTYSGDSTTAKLYLDGLFFNNIQQAGGNTILAISDFYISGTAINSFEGLIDEVIIYNRALSADEIASHYKACKK